LLVPVVPSLVHDLDRTAVTARVRQLVAGEPERKMPRREMHFIDYLVELELPDDEV
jgi:hypothetical protein